MGRAKGLYEKGRVLLEQCKELLTQYESRITIRQLYYRLVAAQVIPNSRKGYNTLLSNLARWRKDRLLPADAFCDLTRRVREVETWADLKSRLTDISYWRDLWEGQDQRLEVWCEKDALTTILEPICEKWLVPLFVCRGYASISSLNDSTERLSGKRILYFGDYDPSGVDIPRAAKAGVEFWGARDVDLDVIALTPEQIQEHQLPPVPPKTTDTRTAGFLAKNGQDTVELDALAPDVLARIVEEAIRTHIDLDTWKTEEIAEKREDRLLEAVKPLLVRLVTVVEEQIEQAQDDEKE